MMRFRFLIVCLFIPVSLLMAQGEKFKCNYDDWANRFNSNSEWNSLLESACKDINAEHYTEALGKLRNALTIDSLANGGDMNVFIESQYRRLKDYIEFAHAEGNQEVKSDQGTAEVKETTNTDKEEIAETEKSAEEPSQSNEKKKEDAIVEEPVAVQETPPPSPAEKTAVTVEPATAPAEAEKMKEEVVESTAEKNTGNSVEVQAETVPEQEVPDQKSSEVTPEQAVSAETTPESASAAPLPVSDAGETAKVSFSEEEKAEFQEKGMQKVKQLESFLIQIGSKSTPLSMSSQAMDNAVQLFDREDRTVQVSSVNNTAKPKFKVKTYLQKIRNLNYDEVQIEWADFQYASDFYLGKDGNYYAYVVFSQRFTGTADNKVMYQDITTKRTEIVLKFYEKASQGELKKLWDVFLGDISVMQTESF